MNILEKLADLSRERVKSEQERLPAEELRERAKALGPGGGKAFLAALEKPGISFICEIKKASPSKGLISPDFPYLKIASAYEQAGADCISCLTEPAYFLGADRVFEEVRNSVELPMLRKDFTVWHLHFDNQVLFQLTSAPAEVLPLPKLTLNLRWYFDIDVVKNVMNMQIGVNAIANTLWYAPTYSPDLGQFYAQNNERIGLVPYCDIFANIQWKRACIFLKFTNAFQDWPSSDYFSAYHYVKQTRGFKFGILWPFYFW